jgi:hypothetical protein
MRARAYRKESAGGTVVRVDGGMFGRTRSNFRLRRRRPVAKSTAPNFLSTLDADRGKFFINDRIRRYIYLSLVSVDRNPAHIKNCRLSHFDRISELRHVVRSNIV